MEQKKYIKRLIYFDHESKKVKVLCEQTEYRFNQFIDANDLNNSLLRGEKYIKISRNEEEYIFRIEDIIKVETVPNLKYSEAEQ